MTDPAAASAAMRCTMGHNGRIIGTWLVVERENDFKASTGVGEYSLCKRELGCGLPRITGMNHGFQQEGPVNPLDYA